MFEEQAAFAVVPVHEAPENVVLYGWRQGTESVPEGSHGDVGRKADHQVLFFFVFFQFQDGADMLPAVRWMKTGRRPRFRVERGYRKMLKVFPDVGAFRAIPRQGSPRFRVKELVVMLELSANDEDTEAFFRKRSSTASGWKGNAFPAHGGDFLRPRHGGRWRFI